MAFPTNINQTVITYNKWDVAYFQNYCAAIKNANKKFNNFQNIYGNLGDTVSFDLQYRFVTKSSLVVDEADYQPIEQRKHTLTVDQKENVSMSVTDPERVFNYKTPEAYLNEGPGKGAVGELATKVESNILLNAVSGLNNLDGPYRFFGDGKTAINSYNQLAKLHANARNYSFAEDIQVYIPDTAEPSIIGNGLKDFALNRNNKDAMSWQVAEFGSPPVKYFRSNLLPTHHAGNVGDNETVLTVTAVDDSDATTQITFSGADINDPDAIKKGDLFWFKDTSGQNAMRYLTFVGHVESDQYVQFRALADAGSDGAGVVVVSITPTLIPVAGEKNQNLKYPVVPGLEARVVKSHRAGFLVCGGGLLLAMPRLPLLPPYPSSNEMDAKSGASLRMYYGSIFGKAQTGVIRDLIWGSTLIPEYCMRICFPIDQGAAFV
jgi:hypothetical protein